MQNKHQMITYGYHFLSEAIIIFLIAIPIFHFNFPLTPYWSYLGVVLGICLVFSIFTKFTDNYALYILAAPLLFIVFYLLDYPIVMNLAFTMVLTWRYINIRNELFINRENAYMFNTLIIAAIVLLIVKDVEIILYAYIQFNILLFGYLMSHFIVIKQENRKQSDRKFWAYMIGIVSLGTALFVFLFDVGHFIFIKGWEGFTYLFVFVIRKAGLLLNFIEMDRKELTEEQMDMMGGGEEPVLEVEHSGPSLIEEIDSYIYMAILLTIIGIVIFIAIKHFKRRFKQAEAIDVSEAITYSDLDKDNRQRSFARNLFGRRGRKPSHPVRRLVYQFERKAMKADKGRMRFETVEDWLERIELNVDLDVYQKVRYGDKTVSEQEMDQLSLQLNEVEGSLEN